MIEKTFWGNLEVHLEWVDCRSFFDNLAYADIPSTSSFCLPTKNNELLLTLNPRGWDFIGGHIEKKETAFECMVRESFEEAGILVNENTRFLGAIKVFNPNWKKGDKYPETSFQLFYTTNDFSLVDFNGNFECIERKFFNLNDIENIHHNLLEIHKKILNSLNN